jgi:magnesium transporter
MPLTLIAGIYGMNFQHMPELGWEYGYPMVLLAMLIIGIGIGWFLKQKDWF